jgi:hypothetical protein
MVSTTISVILLFFGAFAYLVQMVQYSRQKETRLNILSLQLDAMIFIVAAIAVRVLFG